MRAKVIFVSIFLLISAICAQAATYKTLHSFQEEVNWPYANLTFDQHGNLYGVAAYGLDCDGRIFEFMPAQNSWNFQFGLCFDVYEHDEREPWGGITFDEFGNLYGTASYASRTGCGAVFKLSGSSGYSVLHYFTGPDGCTPQANLSYRDGKLWGTTTAGGSAGQGTVFAIGTSGDPFTYYSFELTRGNMPLGGINAWNYGTTNAGGQAGQGNIYRLDPVNRLRSKHSFTSDGPAGYSPMGDLLAMYVANVRTMYGTTSSGGKGGGGTVYRLREREPNSERWQLRVLHSFSGADGRMPLAGLSADSTGNLYGTTSEGGEWNCGTVFKLSPGVKDKWSYTVIYSFHSDPMLESFDGCHPSSTVVLDNAGNLYGTTLWGGLNDYGTVYEITP